MTCAVPRTARPCTSAAGRHPPQGVTGQCRRSVDRQLVWHVPGRSANRFAELALAKPRHERDVCFVPCVIEKKVFREFDKAFPLEETDRPFDCPKRAWRSRR